MIDEIGRDDVLVLVQRAEGPCVSLFMPTHESGRGVQQDPIRLKNLRRTAGQRLAAMGLRPGDVEALLEPIKGLIDDTTFWSHQGRGFACFLAPGVVHTYRLDRSLEELVVVGRRFHVRPLLASFLDRRLCYVLALSQNHVRLLASEPPNVTRIDLGDMPTSVDEALAFEDPERQLVQRSGPGGSGMFHGHGGGWEEDKERIRRFLQKIDPPLVDVLANQRPAPVVVAGVEYLVSLFRQATNVADLADGSIEGNSDDVADAELASRAWEVLAPSFDREAKEDADRFLALAGTGQTGDSPTEVVPAAATGRVEVLFVPTTGSVWGSFDETEFAAELHPARAEGVEDLLDAAAVQTWVHGGRVHIVEPGDMPGQGSVAAVYRF